MEHAETWEREGLVYVDSSPEALSGGPVPDWVALAPQEKWETPYCPRSDQQRDIGQWFDLAIRALKSFAPMMHQSTHWRRTLEGQPPFDYVHDAWRIAEHLRVKSQSFSALPHRPFDAEVTNWSFADAADRLSQLWQDIEQCFERAKTPLADRPAVSPPPITDPQTPGYLGLIVDTPNGLTPQQEKLFACLSQNAGRPVSWDDLPKDAFRDRNDIDEGAILKALKRLRDALSPDGSPPSWELTISENSRSATLAKLKK